MKGRRSMNRPLAFLAALLFAAIAVSSACIARSNGDAISFELKPARLGGQLQLALWDRTDGRGHNFMGSSYPATDFVGLDYRALAAGSSHPIAFALVRDAGRVDCVGSGSNNLAKGTCRF